MALQEEFEQQGIWLFKRRSFLPLTILFLGLFFYLKNQLNPGYFTLTNTSYEFYYEIGCLIIGLLGLYIRVYTVGYSSKNTSGRNTTKGQVADSVNTTGIYSTVRHPLYLGNWLMWLAPALLTQNWWFIIAFCMLYWVYYERIMFAEEQFLRRKFGEQYLNWANDVPAFFPAFGKFEKPDRPFNWKDSLKRENNGLLALFLILFVFNISGEIINNETDFNNIFLYGFILSAIGYLTIKFLTKKTRVLTDK
jgi:protein-S-isoprenylcysteine O-methyltransferase Ste14